ncbi:MFS general substrate transporter [Aspergillus heteromorphus CBS 117.55]|uniref:MFS general substrate transporter n=1 Tax=Aspergillus heteromorphus CBS 117.55 TaxID=1448321 RepID=A0A317W140_9EURO|nr:MFS general substrate transporter [Aspergillus heteromorphus CBS 117.55]PWY79695.1 MFS general substrate transporter [Aspergillus heteromorphus CBS 117.55]
MSELDAPTPQNDGSPSYPPPAADSQNGPVANEKGLRFWLIFLAIGIATFVAALDTSIISTALPTITADLSSGDLYVWVINTYLLSSTVSSAIVGQMSNIFGRRAMTTLALLIFAAGSAVSGAAQSTGMLLAGRTIQGLGGGAITTLSEVLVCDMVSLRERGVYAGILGAAWAMAAVVGPLMGGGFTQNVSWRWIFYINLPITGAALALIVTLLRVRNPRQDTSLWHRLRTIDWGGMTLLTLGVTSILLALTWAGTMHPWSSWRTIVPIVLGFLGLLAFIAYEASPLVPEPTMPPRLFTNRTTATLFLMSFIYSMLLFWICYFLPVYFQAVLGATPSRSAVMLFPIATTTAPAGIVAGAMMTKTGKYRLWHFGGFALMTVACGLFTLFDQSTPTGAWTGYQILFGIGTGVVFTTGLPPILATLAEGDVATGTATWIFMRNFGAIWGTAIPAAVFNTRADRIAGTIADEEVRALFVDGGAYQRATKVFVDGFKGDKALYAVIETLYVRSLREVWQVSIAFSAVGFLLCFLVKEYRLRDDLNTEYGMQMGETVGLREEGSMEGEGENIEMGEKTA